MRLIAAQPVRPFVHTNKIDRTDARAIWEAAGRPEVKWGAVKSGAAQAVLALHRLREQLKDMRHMRSNRLQGLLYKLGVVARSTVTAASLEAGVVEGRVSGLLQASLREQLERLARPQREALELKRRIQHDARGVIEPQRKAKRLSPWLSGLLARWPLNVAVVALANKMARTAGAARGARADVPGELRCASGVAD